MWIYTHKINVGGGKELNSLNAFVRQRAHTEGSIVHGYMVYQSIVYISQYLPNLEKNINLPCIWHVKPINKFEGGVLMVKGRTRKVKGN